MVADRRDLGAVGDDQDLPVRGQARQALADRGRGGAADAAVDLVEDQAAPRADPGQHHLERQQEARQLAGRGDLADRAGPGARVGRHLENDALQAVGTPGGLLQALEAGREGGLVQLEGRQLLHDRPVEPGGGIGALPAERLGGGEVGLARRRGRRRQLGQAFLAGIDARELGGQVLAQGQQLVDLDAVLAGDVLQGEEALVDLLQALRVQLQVAGQRLQAGGDVAQLRGRPVQAGDDLVQTAPGLVDDPLQGAEGAAHGGLGAGLAVLAVELDEGLVDRAGELLAVLQEGALLGQGGLFAGLGIQGLQLGDGMTQEVLVLPGLLELRLLLALKLHRRAPGLPGGGDLRGRRLQAAGGVEQVAMGPGIQEAALLEVAMDLDQALAQAAQQADRDRLVVHEGPAAAVGAEVAAQDQKAVLGRQAVLRQQPVELPRIGDVEGGGHRRLPAACPQQAGVGPAAQR